MTTKLEAAQPKQEPVVTPHVYGWFVKDFADGWVFFDNKDDADRQVDATGAMMLAGIAAPAPPSPAVPAKVWVCMASDRYYDEGSDWVVGVYATELEAREAGKAAHNGDDHYQHWEIEETVTFAASPPSDDVEQLREENARLKRALRATMAEVKP